MKPRRSCLSWAMLLLAWLVLSHDAFCGVANANAIESTTNSSSIEPPPPSTDVKYMSTNEPACGDSLTHTILTLYGRNRNIYEQCVSESQGYSLFPFSGYLPSDSQLIAMVSSLPCLAFFQALVTLSSVKECNLGGIDLLSALETLLMTSQDIVASVAPLTSSQFVEFIQWRHLRNIAKANKQPYDKASDSAVQFDTQLKEAATRLQVTLNEQLQITAMDGRIVGSSVMGSVSSGEVAGEAEAREAKDSSSSSSSSSTGETTTKSSGDTISKTSSAARSVHGVAKANGTVLPLGVLISVVLGLWSL